MKFRVRKGDVEIEFDGEPAEALKRYDELIEWARSTQEGEQASPSQEVHIEANGKKGQRRTTGESKMIRERIQMLVREGYFKTPKGLAEVRKEMQTRGWYHESWNIQPVLLRQGRDLGVRRIQDQGGYKYVET